MCVCVCARAFFTFFLRRPLFMNIHCAPKKIVINDTTTGATTTATATTAGYKLDQTRRRAQTKIITEKIQYIYVCVCLLYIYIARKSA